MAKLTTTRRKKLKPSQFGLPSKKGKGKSSENKAGKGGYPMPDKSHAINAKARAKQMLNRGKLSKAEYNKIVAKANKKLGKK